MVALVPDAGPVPPPDMVVTPDIRACSICWGQMKWICASRPLAVAMSPSPAMASAPGASTISTPRCTSVLPAFPLPPTDRDAYNWDNLLSAIGASKHWQTRYVALDGFVITKTDKNQYNWQDGWWANYHKGEEKPFTCGTCHTTG